MEYDYYKVLGVGDRASAQAIKRAYRKKAKSLHPDINPDPKAHELFALAKDAYETLSDRVKRERYDRELQQAYREHGREEVRQQRPSRPVYEPEERRHPLVHNLPFLFGVIFGAALVLLSIGLLLFVPGWPKLGVITVIPGVLMVRGGWRGLEWKHQINALPPVRWVRAFFKINYD
ncbi:MAG: DnaJ domain-containing protein [Bacteroidota bacterium]